MQVSLRLSGTFREAVGDTEVTRTVDGEEPTVGAVLQGLADEYPDLDLFEDGELNPYVNVVKDGRNVQHEDGLETRLAEGDELSVFPPVEGG